MPPPDRKVIEEWFEFGREDFECGDFLISNAVFLPQAMERMQQAMEKYLKGFLLSQGWTLEKTHDLGVLLEEAIKHEPTFSRFAETAESLSQRYVEERYPGLARREVALDEARQRRSEVAELIALIRSLTP